MRDYAGFRAVQRENSEAFPKLRRMLRNWFTRRHFRQLDRLDDFILRDIGLKREDVAMVKRLPLDVDPIPELIRLRAVASGLSEKHR
jgi:uncharacterized protein YjiS (DUF1127 family)